jgi:hypothetical protein
LAYANRHSSPPYRWAFALRTLEEGVFWREMIKKGCRSNPIFFENGSDGKNETTFLEVH